MSDIKFKNVDYELLNDTYKELIEVVGVECAEKIYEHYRGQLVNFPVRIYNSQSIKIYLKSNLDCINTKDISRNLGCSERWIRKIKQG